MAMYTASVKNTILEGSKRRFIITFTDGVTPFDKEYVQDVGYMNIEALKSQVALVLNDLNNPKTVSNGAFDTTPATVTPPTQAQLDQTQWFLDWGNLKGANQLIAAGILTGNEAAYTALKNKVTTNFKAAYVPFL